MKSGYSNFVHHKEFPLYCRSSCDRSGPCLESRRRGEQRGTHFSPTIVSDGVIQQPLFDPLHSHKFGTSPSQSTTVATRVPRPTQATVGETDTDSPTGGTGTTVVEGVPSLVSCRPGPGRDRSSLTLPQGSGTCLTHERLTSLLSETRFGRSTYHAHRLRPDTCLSVGFVVVFLSSSFYEPHSQARALRWTQFLDGL